ncbi:MAG TPA: hypothetical protein VIC86_11565, partial [Acidimicrobiales bacterium]
MTSVMTDSPAGGVNGGGSKAGGVKSGGSKAEAADPSGSRAARSLAAAVEVIAGFVSGFEPGRYRGEDAATLVATF